MQMQGEETGVVWDAAHSLLVCASQLAGAPGGGTALRVPALKLCEHAALLLFADAAPPLAPGGAAPPLPAALRAAGADALQRLADTVAAPGAAALPGPVLITAVKGLAAVALARPQALGTALPPLLELATRVRWAG